MSVANCANTPEILLGTDIWPWYFSLSTVGEEGIPILRRSTLSVKPVRAKPLQNVRANSNNLPGTLVHVYTNDNINARLAKRPLHYFDRVSTAAAFGTPDLSIYRVLPRSQRVFHTVVNRGVGAVLQS